MKSALFLRRHQEGHRRRRRRGRGRPDRAPVHRAPLEQGNGVGRYSGSGWGFRGGRQYQAVMQNNGGPSDVTDTLAPGKISIRANVRAEFALKQRA
ncbi:MAG TPA: hypothetical protein ENO14_03915 [Chromatiales bacterium]|nr:hypothetical protein [Chromatiales bacterium]